MIVMKMTLTKIKSWRGLTAFSLLLIVILAGCGGNQASRPVILATAVPLPTVGMQPITGAQSGSTVDPADVVQAPDLATATPLPPPTATIERPTPASYSGLPTPDSAYYDTDVPGLVSYTVVPNDTLFLIATKFDITLEELMGANGLSDSDFVVVGQTLAIPVETAGVGPAWKIIPDSELIYGPTVADFSTGDFLRRYYPQSTLLRYQESVEGRPLNGAGVVDLVAIRFSVNPRLLLAMIEYRSRWVSQPVPNFAGNFYPMGIERPGQEGLYNQLSIAANLANYGFYGRDEGGLRTIDFDDETRLVIDPTINHGTAGVQVWLAGHTNANPTTWRSEAGEQGFSQTYFDLFGNPFGFTADEPLKPRRLRQPTLTLPWEPDVPWYFTGGPHGGWAGGSAWAALDFGPDKEKRGCYVSEAWVVAAAPGTVVYSDFGGVLLDLDGDGDPGTGWVLVHWHVDQSGRVELGSELETGDRIGHASCEGGFSNGTHLHFARRYNGQWIGADGDLPFVLDGWTSSGTGNEYDGYLVKRGISKEACVCAEEINELVR